jgi:hypothetical protein
VTVKVPLATVIGHYPILMVPVERIDPGGPEEGGPEQLLALHEMDFACVPDISLETVASISDRP